jgi:hypothetical protein
MKPQSTFRILKAKAFNENFDDSLIDWAFEMIEAGYESINLYTLAGVLKPYNQFELQELTSAVFKDLNFDYGDKKVALNNYIFYLLSCAVDHPEKYLDTLRKLKEMCEGYEQDFSLTDFSLLYWAKEDLIYASQQWYWEGASRENIDEIIKDYFKNWMTEFLKNCQTSSSTQIPTSPDFPL